MELKMIKIDQHIHDTVQQIDQEAAKSSYSMRLDDLGIPDVSPEQQAAFEKAMEEYDDHGLGARPDMMDDDRDIEGNPL